VNTLLANAIELANQVHDGQVDLGGQPYILHPLRVMMALGPNADSIDRAVAILHDVLEDDTTGVALLRLDQVFPREVREAVMALTKLPNEPYLLGYISRVAKNPIAKRVKLADLADNLAPERQLKDRTPKQQKLDEVRRGKYLWAVSLLKGS
jgi:(p)ppGpp synthase/HD superfamily hydrolase